MSERKGEERRRTRRYATRASVTRTGGMRITRPVLPIISSNQPTESLLDALRAITVLNGVILHSCFKRSLSLLHAHFRD